MLTRSGKLGNTGDDLSFDSALVVSSSDLEEALVTPALVPAVGDQPVRSAVLDSPADDLDGVASKSRSRSVVINSTLVGQEVVVDGEGSFNGTVSHDLSLDLGDIGRNAVDGLSEPSVLGVGSGVAIDAGGLALGSRLRGSTRSVLAAIDVMITRREGVGLAVPSIIVKVTGYNTSLLPVVHSSRGVATVAALATTNSTASQKIFR